MSRLILSRLLVLSLALFGVGVSHAEQTSLALGGVSPRFLRVVSEHDGQRTVEFLFHAQFSGAQSSVVMTSLNGAAPIRHSLNAQTSDLSWVAQFSHPISAAHQPIVVPLEIRNEQNPTEKWQLNLQLEPWPPYKIQVMEASAIGNYYQAQATNSTPRLTIDQLCLSQPVQPRANLSPSLKLKFEVTLTASVGAQIYYPQDPSLGPHAEAVPAGQYDLQMVFLRHLEDENPRIVSSVHETIEVDGGATLAQVNLPVRVMADLLPRTYVLAQLTGLAGVSSVPQLFQLGSMAGGCATATPVQSSTKLKALLARYPIERMIPELQKSLQQQDQKQSEMQQARATAENLSNVMGAKLYQAEGARPTYLTDLSTEQVQQVLSCLDQASWDTPERKARCQFENKQVASALQAMCRQIVRAPRRVIGFNDLWTSMRGGMTPAQVRSRCQDNPLQYLTVEKKTVIRKAGELSPENDLGGVNFAVSINNGGHSSIWTTHAAAVEDEDIAQYTFGFHFDVRKSGTKEAPVPDSAEAAFPASMGVEGVWRGAGKPRIGRIWDAFDYAFDIEYNFTRFGYTSDMELDVQTQTINVPAKEWQECYFVHASIPWEDRQKLAHTIDYKLATQINDMICFAPQTEPKVFKETYYYVVNSMAPGGATVDSADLRNRSVLTFRGERDFAIWYRSIKDVARPFERTGVALDVSHLAADSIANFARHTATVDSVINGAPPQELGIRPEPSRWDTLTTWLRKRLHWVWTNPFDLRGTHQAHDMNARDLNPDLGDLPTRNVRGSGL